MLKHALKFVVAIAASALLLACASDSNKNTAPKATGGGLAAVADAGALAGTWAAGETKITFEGASYTWEQTRPCGAPPCPVSTKTGTFEVRRGQVYMTPEGDTVTVYDAKVGTSPRGLWLKDSKTGTEHSLK